MTISTAVLAINIGKEYCLLSELFLNRILTLAFETVGTDHYQIYFCI